MLRAVYSTPGFLLLSGHTRGPQTSRVNCSSRSTEWLVERLDSPSCRDRDFRDGCKGRAAPKVDDDESSIPRDSSHHGDIMHILFPFTVAPTSVSPQTARGNSPCPRLAYPRFERYKKMRREDNGKDKRKEGHSRPPAPICLPALSCSSGLSPRPAPYLDDRRKSKIGLLCLRLRPGR